MKWLPCLAWARKTALRYVLNLLSRSEAEVGRFTAAIDSLRKNTKLCKECYNISDTDLCGICSNMNRERTTLCVVEDIRDVMALESTHQYKGLYHVLGGKISPMDGIGPSDLHVGGFVERLQTEGFKEIIFALSPTMEGDTTAYYLFKKIESRKNLRVTTLSRGVAVGDELQYADEITLGRSILQRTLYDTALS